MNKTVFYSLLPLLLSIGAVNEAKVPSSMQEGVDFRPVAKKGIPAVVSIRVSGNASAGLTVDNFYNNENFEAFGDPFWNKFSEIPFPQSKMPQAKEPQVMGQASGFIVSQDGYILTNSHVVNGATDILVTLSDKAEFQAKLIGQDPNTDIALIKIDKQDLPYLKLGNSATLEVGEWVMAIGTPLGLQASVSAGIVSAVGRNNLELAQIEDFIQTDAAINQGNSGGPLLDLSGDVIGINTAIVTNKGGGGYIGIGFAIPSSIVSHILEQLKTKGSVTRGFLGVTLQKIDDDLALALGLKKIEGALVAEVSQKSPAEKAGFKQGDVIVSFNDLPAKDTASLRNMVALSSPGETVKIKVLRQGKEISLNTQMGELLPPHLVPNKPIETAKIGVVIDKLGVSVESISPRMASSGIEGVIISQVDAGSPAAWVGLRQGTLILSVNHKKIATPQEFDKEIAENDAAKPLLLLIKQGEAIRYISLKPT